MIGQKDPLIGTLPPKKDARSPALTGQDSSITGVGGAGGIGQMPTSESALAPAPPPGGNAQVGGAPLSSNEAQIRQGGAGADLDLLTDRGTSEEYWAGTLKTLGSAKALDFMASAADAASGKTGQQANMDPEEVRRSGVQANEAFGVGNTREQQDSAVENIVYQPMTAQVRAEVETGVLSEDDGVMRVAQTIAQVQGPTNEDELAEIVVEARKRVTGKPVEVTSEMGELTAGSEQVKYETERKRKEASKDHDGDGKKDSIWSRAKTWWKKGQDDPTTSVDESKETYIGPDGKPQTRDVEVTKFMGGMTRQELGMFVFQWGSQMMANADKGFGGAMGAAGEGAMAGHLERTAADQATKAGAAQQEIENKLNQQRADAATVTANKPVVEWGKDGAFTMEIDKDGNRISVPVLGPDGKQIQESPSSANRPYATQQLQAQLEATGFFSAQEIAILISKQPGKGEVRAEGLRAWERRMADKLYPNGMRSTEWKELSEVEKNKMRSKFVEDYVGEYMKAYETQDKEGALPEISDEEAAQRALQQSSST